MNTMPNLTIFHDQGFFCLHIDLNMKCFWADVHIQKRRLLNLSCMKIDKFTFRLTIPDSLKRNQFLLAYNAQSSPSSSSFLWFFICWLLMVQNKSCTMVFRIHILWSLDSTHAVKSKWCARDHCKRVFNYIVFFSDHTGWIVKKIFFLIKYSYHFFLLCSFVSVCVVLVNSAVCVRMCYFKLW